MPHYRTATTREAIREIGLAVDKVIVIGSGILDRLGIRAANDIDLVAERGLFVSLDGRDDLVRYEDERGVHYAYRDAIEIWQDWGMPGDEEKTYDELLPNTVVYDDVRYMSLAYVKQWKLQKGREKDLQDVVLIEQYEVTHG